MSMVALLAGMAGGYTSGSQQKRDNDRQAKQDEWMQEQQDRQRQDWKDQDRLKSDLKGAAAPVTMEQGAGGMVKPEAMDNRDVGLPENSALPDAGLMQGGFKVGSQSFVDKAQADKTVSDQNTPDAVNQRTAQAYRSNGQAEKALTMENAVMDSKLKKLGLSTAEAAWANEQYNTKISEGIASQETPELGIAHVLSQTQVGSLAGVNVTPKIRPDGKTVDYVGVGADGAEKILRTLPIGQEGYQMFMQDAGKAKLETKIGYVTERIKAEKATAKEKKDDDRWQQTFDFNKKKDENDTQYKNRVLGFQASQERRASDLHKIAMDDHKVPTAVKQLAETYRDQIKTSSAALYKSMAEGNYKANDPGVITLGEQQAAAAAKYRTLLEPYMTASKGTPAAAADPLGLDKPAPGAATAAPLGAIAPKTSTAPAQTATMQQVAAIPEIAVLQQKEDEEMMLGKRTKYSPEVQAVVNAKAAEQAKQESEYLARERARALVPPMR